MTQARTFLALLFSISFSSRLCAAIIPADRLPLPGTWESAGVEGGIPSRTKICANVLQPPYNADNTGATSAVSAIQSAINACPEGEVVYVPAGTYLIDHSEWDNLIAIRKSITLRGDGASTVFLTKTGSAISIGRISPWPPPKANTKYILPVTGGSSRGSSTVSVSDASSVVVGKMIMVDEIDDPSLVWTKPGNIGRFRGSLHLVTSKTSTSVTFRPALPISYTRSPQLSWIPDLVQYAGVEKIKFVGFENNPAMFIRILSAWNCWVRDCEFTAMPSKTIFAELAGHLEISRNFLHEQSNGGPNSEGIDLFADVSWSLIQDNVCVAAGYPQINIGDGGPNAYYSGGFGNVIAYNYAVDSFYNDPNIVGDFGKMTIDIGTNHSPHNQYNLLEGNYVGQFGFDSYHGSGSHTTLFRNVATANTRWTRATSRTAIQLDRRNLFTNIVGNVLGEVGKPTTHEYVEESGWRGSTIFRLGFPNVGNNGFSGVYPPTELNHGDGGPRDLYALRNNTPYGTTIIEGNWNSVSNKQDWTVTPESLPDSLYLTSKPTWFGSLRWPPVDPAQPVTNDPSIIPAGYRYLHGISIPSSPVQPPPTSDTDDGGEQSDSSSQAAFNPTKGERFSFVVMNVAVGTIRATVYDRKGEIVATVDLGEQAVGPVTIEWDGRNKQDIVVSAGTYSFVLRLQGKTIKRKVVVVK